MGRTISLSNAWPIARYVLISVAFLIIVVVLMMWLMGVFHPKVGDGISKAVAEDRLAEGAKLEAARMIRVPANETAVGSIQAVHETSVASKLLAKVMEVNVKAGQKVRAGEVLVRLDDEDLKARQMEASAAVDAAQARKRQAKVELERIQNLFKQQAAAQIELDRVKTAYDTAEALLEQAQQVLKQAETFLSYATVKSPMNGIVVDKKVDVGDTVQPGEVLITLYDPTHMQLVASVRESLAHRMTVGQIINVEIDALSLKCPGMVSEIVPEAEAATRSFLVKVTGPCPPGIYAGMFGRMIITLDEQEILVIPQAAVRRVGQLDMVDVAEGDVLHRRIVQLGRTFGEQVQVLSGMKAGEKVVLYTNTSTNQQP